MPDFQDENGDWRFPDLPGMSQRFAELIHADSGETVTIECHGKLDRKTGECWAELTVKADEFHSVVNGYIPEDRVDLRIRMDYPAIEEHRQKGKTMANLYSVELSDGDRVVVCADSDYQAGDVVAAYLRQVDGPDFQPGSARWQHLGTTDLVGSGQVLSGPTVERYQEDNKKSTPTARTGSK